MIMKDFHNALEKNAMYPGGSVEPAGECALLEIVTRGNAELPTA